MRVKGMSKKVDVFAERFLIWHPNPFHRFIVHPLLFVLVVKSREEQSVKAHLSVESGVGVRMAERINLPPDPWLYTEFFFDPLVTDEHVVYHVIVSWASLVMHRPSTIYEFKLATFYESFNSVLHIVILVIPPHVEELHLNLGEFSIRVVNERPYNVSELNLDISPLNVPLRAIEVLIYGL